MNRINRLAVAIGTFALALSVGAAWANEKDRQPTSAASPTTTSTPSSRSSSTMPSSGTTTAPSSASTTTSTASTTASTDNGRAVGRPFVQFKDLDADNDGTITAAELSANTSVSIDLAQYDTNKDGKLSESEYARYKNQMARNNPDKEDKMPEKR